jgi:hypothetical protein
MNAEELFDDANGHLAIGELEQAAGGYRQAVELAPDFSTPGRRCAWP